jgi:hypothetical protein
VYSLAPVFTASIFPLIHLPVLLAAGSGRTSARLLVLVGSLRSYVINDPLVPLSLRDIYTEPWSSRVKIEA